VGEQITADFNDPLAGLPRMDRPQKEAGKLKERLLELIDAAKGRIDAAVYSIGDREVISALQRACSRGVKLRVVTETEEYHGQLARLPCLALKLDENERLMHDKFMIVDNEIVWTGSANWTPGSLYFDANNALEIQDKKLAQAYELEFSQMFRAGQFGPQKEDNNAEEFEVAGTAVEAYFPPSDHPEGILTQLIAQAKESIEIAMFYFTDGALYQALVSALKRGVKIGAVWDERGFENFAISQMDELISLGVGVVDANPGLVHDKYAIIDGKITVSGSANWTRSGMGYNDEDIVVVHSPQIAHRFAENFERLYQDAQSYDQDPKLPPRVTIKHYNTQDVPARVEWRPHLLNKPDFYELCRARSPDGPCEKTFSNIPNDHWYFADETAQKGVTYHYRMRSSLDGKYSDWSNEYVVTAGPPDCPSSGAAEECDCDDGLDNDGNGYLDCDDYDCAAATACIGPEWPTIKLAAPVSEVLSAEEVEHNLKKYLGRAVTIRFYVLNTYDSGKAIFLDSSKDYQKDFTAVIFKRDEPNFLAAGIKPELDYDHRLIEVSGELEEYNGPEIILSSPAQVRVVK